MKQEVLRMMHDIWVTASPFAVVGLIIALIVVCIRKRERNEGLSQGFTRKDFRYVCIIFFVVIVFVLVIALAGDESAFQYFSFASTITSMILSVIAIIMTILSDQKSESTKRAIDDSVSRIKEANEKIEAFVKRVEELTDRIIQVQEEVKKVSDRTTNIEAAINKKEYGPASYVSVPDHNEKEQTDS